MISNKWRILYGLVGLLFMISCREEAAAPTAVPTPILSTPLPTETPEPPPTLNAIAAAVATQEAAAAAEEAARPTPVPMPDDSLELVSPDGRHQLRFALRDGVPYYTVFRDQQPVILPSRLGLSFLQQPSLAAGLTIVDWETGSHDQSWTQPWGEVKEVRDHHNALRVSLTTGGDAPRLINLVFRAYNDGVAFRYELPEQPHLDEFAIMREHTEFALPDDHEAWWIGAYLDNRYEYLYSQTPLSRLTNLATGAVHTPLTMATEDGLYLSIHEAALVDYSSMTLRAEENLVLSADLVPWSDGVLVYGRAPLRSPWRTIQIAADPGGLITSTMILNLNEPNVLEDVSWIAPSKYVGIWWGMHLDKWSWSSGPAHGATTENTQAYIDFAAENGFRGVLVEGWNLGWDGNWTLNGDRFDFTTPYPDFDLTGLAAYAAERGVRLIGHHETAVGVQNYENQLEEAFALYQQLGIDAVKTGYVGYGQGIPRLDDAGVLIGYEWHHGQFMVEHHQRVVETAARYGIMVNIHEPIKDTGLRRTYPNLLTREGARGQEYNAWDGQGGNPPDHVTILPFTRLLSGPMDYTPGVLDLTFDQYRPFNRVNHTLAKELALYVVIYSPLQMAADLIENYEAQPAFQFIRDVPADWHETRVLHAQIGDYVTIVRRERDGDDWYLGALTDEEGRTLTAPLDFLAPDVTYTAVIYADGPAADWEENPYDLIIEQMLVNAETVLTLQLAPGGGQAIRFAPVTD